MSADGCAFGPCVLSLVRGGAGCDLCDRVAHLSQQDQTKAFKLKEKTMSGYALECQYGVFATHP